MAAITYNGTALPTQLRKLTYTRTERDLTYSGIHAVAPSALAALMAALRVDDATLVISGTGYSETFTLNGSDTACTELRTIVEKVGEPSDGESMVLVRFQVRAKFQSFRADKFRSYSFSWLETDQDTFTLTVTGEVTATDSSNTALENFDAGIDAVENIGKALLGDLDDGNLSARKDWYWYVFKYVPSSNPSVLTSFDHTHSVGWKLTKTLSPSPLLVKSQQPIHLTLR